MSDAIKNPSHYMLMGQETITIIASSMTLDEWRGYCRGNAIKYRMRLGKKDPVEQDLGKAMYYEELFEEHNHLCRDFGIEEVLAKASEAMKTTFSKIGGITPIQPTSFDDDGK